MKDVVRDEWKQSANLPMIHAMGQHCPSPALEAVRCSPELVNPQVQTVLQWWYMR